MKHKTRKLLSILLALAMVSSLLPMSALAGGNPKVTSVAITYDAAMVPVTTKMTGKQVSEALIAATTESAGEMARVNISSIYDTCLVRTYGGSYYTFAANDELLNAMNQYYFCFEVQEKSGYEWDTEALPTVTVNGTAVPAERVEWGYQDITGFIKVYFPVSPTNQDAVASVSVSASTTKAAQGDTVQCTAHVLGSVETVNWSVIGKNSSNTTVDNTGKLTVGSDETAASLTVRATSTFDNAKYGEATIEISQTSLSINSVTVSPATVTLYKGGDKMFSASVDQTGGADTEVSWSVIGATSSNTTINADGSLMVGSDEAAATLTVRATSVYDPSKYGEATVTVQTRPKVTQVAIVYDASQVTLDTTVTGRQVSEALIAATTESAGEMARVNISSIYDTCLVSTYGGSYYAFAANDELLNAMNQYYFCFEVEEKSGYEWDTEALPTVTVNGTAVPAERVEWGHQDITGFIKVYFPVSLSGGAATYTVTFNANGHGTAPAAQTVEEGQKATKPADPAESGWTFGGWYKEAACTNAFDFGTAITEDITLYAKWTEVAVAPVTYSVSFNANGHGAAPAAQTVEKGQKATKPADLTASGWKFGGWFKEAACANAFDFGTAITGNITLYAKWTKEAAAPATYSVSFNANGHGTAPAAQTVEKGQKAAKPADPAESGWKFGGWFKEAACTNAFDFGTAITGNITLYAKWTKEAAAPVTYSVSFNANGGSGAPAAQTKTHGVNLVLSKDVPTRDGYAFQGWAISKDGEVKYKAGATYSENKAVTLYAVWKQNAVAYLPGDINGDGKVNIFDVIRLLKKVTGETVETVANTDVNGDGKVNIFDVIRLLKYVTGENVEVK